MVVLSAAVSVALYYNPPTSLKWVPACPFHAVTGLYCPGCGSLRGLHQLVHLNVLGALRCNVMLIIAVPLLLYRLASTVCVSVSGRRAWSLSMWPRAGWIVAAVLMAHWVLRNVAIYPFTLLAPH